MSEPVSKTQIEAAIQASVTDTLALLARLRDDLLQRLTSTQGVAASRLHELLDALDAGVQRFRQDYGALLDQGRQTLASLGAQAVDAATAGLDILVPDLTTTLLQALPNVTAELVTRISANLQADLAREIQLGVLGVKAPFDVIHDIQQLLDVEGASGYAARAETITRTEVGRAQSEATQAHLENAERQGVPVKKQWLHGGSRQPRSAHVAASGQIRPVREPFIINGVRLMYPRDAAAPASETVNCRCIALPYLA